MSSFLLRARRDAFFRTSFLGVTNWEVNNLEYKELIVTTYPSSIRQKSLLICVAYLLQARLSVVNPITNNRTIPEPNEQNISSAPMRSASFLIGKEQRQKRRRGCPRDRCLFIGDFQARKQPLGKPIGRFFHQNACL